MPIVFIHGVNTRGGTDFRNGVHSPEGRAYGQAQTARDALIKRLLLEPLGPHYANMSVVNPYWGDLGAQFRWNNASLPEVHTLQHLGPDPYSTFQSDLAYITTLDRLAAADPARPVQLDQLGSPSHPRTRAAQADLPRFLEAVLSPILLSEHGLVGAGLSPEQAGLAEALLVIATQDVAADPRIHHAVANAPDDGATMRLLHAAVEQRFITLLSATPPPTADARLETLGGADWFAALRHQLGESFDRARDAPLRLAAIPTLDMVRQGLQQNLGRFFGDVFVYLLQRGDADHPGPIVTLVLDAIRAAVRSAPDEPLIVITHSMGGNIFYDILTHYAPDLRVAAWIAVASQAGQFEEMKLFHASDPAVGAPDRVAGLKPRLGYWLNVYDPADIFSYRSSPIFAAVDEDLPYLTGAGVPAAHSAYFKRPSFYTLLRERLAPVLP